MKQSLLLSDNSSNVIISDSVAMLSKAGYEDCYISQFTDDAVSVLNDYAALIGEGTEVEYSLAKRPLRIELKIYVRGTQFDPLQAGSEARKRKLASVPFRSFLENKTPQLVVLGFLLGSALLVLGDGVDELKEILIKIVYEMSEKDFNIKPEFTSFLDSNVFCDAEH